MKIERVEINSVTLKAAFTPQQVEQILAEAVLKLAGAEDAPSGALTISVTRTSPAIEVAFAVPDAQVLPGVNVSVVIDQNKLPRVGSAE